MSLPALPGSTDRHRTILAAVFHDLVDDADVLGAWLGGSFGQGAADAWSDLDIHCYVEDNSLASIAQRWPGRSPTFADPVMSLQLGRPEAGVVGWALVTPQWDHVDLMFYGRSHAAAQVEWGIVPLFDRGGALPSEPRPPRPAAEPWFPRHAVESFFYGLGNLPVVIGRGEVLLAATSVAVLRDQVVIPLMHAERGVAPRGGLKRLSQHLSDDQVADLLTMPPITLDIESIVTAHVWLWRIFVPRARALAERTGGDYPAAFEQATAAHLERTLGVRLASAPSAVAR